MRGTSISDSTENNEWTPVQVSLNLPVATSRGSGSGHLMDDDVYIISPAPVDCQGDLQLICYWRYKLFYTVEIMISVKCFRESDEIWP
jgi:hypothetical protein